MALLYGSTASPDIRKLKNLSSPLFYKPNIPCELELAVYYVQFGKIDIESTEVLPQHGLDSLLRKPSSGADFAPAS
jgi:hypothetical protein